VLALGVKDEGQVDGVKDAEIERRRGAFDRADGGTDSPEGPLPPKMAPGAKLIADMIFVNPVWDQACLLSSSCSRRSLLSSPTKR
jgi:hypothetical protein